MQYVEVGANNYVPQVDGVITKYIVSAMIDTVFYDNGAYGEGSTVEEAVAQANASCAAMMPYYYLSGVSATYCNISIVAGSYPFGTQGGTIYIPQQINLPGLTLSTDARRFDGVYCGSAAWVRAEYTQGTPPSGHNGNWIYNLGFWMPYGVK